MFRNHGVVVQGEDANDFNPDRFLGKLPVELADTKDGALFSRIITEFSRISFLQKVDPFSFHNPN